MSEQQTNFQSCSGLEVIDEHKAILESNGDALSSLMLLQHSIQEEVYGFNFTELRGSYKAMMKFVNWNYGASQDEWREFYTALGGMSAFEMSFWKTWKGNHKDALASSFESLSEKDKLEAWFEIIDLMHFMFNIAIVLNINSKDIKFFFWNPEGEYQHTMEGNETFEMMLDSLFHSDETSGKQNSIMFSNERLLDFVDYKHKVWQGRMITLFEIITESDFGWYLGAETADKHNHRTNRLINVQKPDIIGNWVEAFKALMHIAVILGMDERTITNLYYSKNKHNRERQQKAGGY